MDITFWTTMDCNLNCAYCYNRANNNIKKEYMLRDTAKKAIELFRKIEHFGGDDLYINFHGGEPLLNCEVTGNLDMAMGNEVIKFLKKMNELYNQTIVIVTHDQDIAAQMDRIITIADGSVINDKEVCIKNSCKK